MKTPNDPRGSTPPEGDQQRDAQGAIATVSIDELLIKLLVEQLAFRRHLAQRLNVDSAGLDTMIHLAGAETTTPSDIARHLETSTAAASLVLNRLEASGHISREPHPTDGRKVVVVPAPESLGTAFACAGPVMGGTQDLIATLSEAERDTVVSFLENLVRVYGDALR